MSEFTTKDSGAREQLANGMVRDTDDGKADYTLILDGPMFERWSALLGRGAAKYGAHNWTKALASTDPAARAKTTERFRRSALRHMVQWLRGDRDEDHAAAVIFNLNGYEAMLATEPKAQAEPAPSRPQRTFDPDAAEQRHDGERPVPTLVAASPSQLEQLHKQAEADDRMYALERLHKQRDAELEIDRKVGPVPARRELPL